MRRICVALLTAAVLSFFVSCGMEVDAKGERNSVVSMFRDRLTEIYTDTDMWGESHTEAEILPQAEPTEEIEQTEEVSVPERSPEPQSNTVYWTKSGKVYHTDPECRGLAKAKEVFSGTAEESRKERACKICG